MVSLLLFVVVAGSDLLSISTRDGISFGDAQDTQIFGLSRGCAIYYEEIPLTDVAMQPRPFEYSFFGFSAARHPLPNSSTVAYFRISAPLYAPLILLFIAPLCWLIAGPANAPAFPIITDANPSSDNRVSGVNS